MCIIIKKMNSIYFMIKWGLWSMLIVQYMTLKDAEKNCHNKDLYKDSLFQVRYLQEKF